MRGGETTNILGVHAIMNRFADPWRFSRGNRRLQVYDSKIDPLCARRAATRRGGWLGRPASSCGFAGPVVFVRLKGLSAGGGFGDFGPFQFFQRITPDIIETQWTRY